MSILTTWNEAYPRPPETLLVQRLMVQLGLERFVEFVEDQIVYSGAGSVVLSGRVAAGTTPFVFLRGLRLTPGLDFQIESTVSGSSLVFIGDAYSVEEGDVLSVLFYTPTSSDLAPLYSVSANVSVVSLSAFSTVEVPIPLAHHALVGTIQVYIGGRLCTKWTPSTEMVAVGGQDILAVTAVTIPREEITEAGVIISAFYQTLEAA